VYATQGVITPHFNWLQLCRGPYCLRPVSALQRSRVEAHAPSVPYLMPLQARAGALTCVTGNTQKPGFFYDEPLPCKPEELPRFEARYLRVLCCVQQESSARLS
jgi:hypothetical protein